MSCFKRDVSLVLRPYIREERAWYTLCRVSMVTYYDNICSTPHFSGGYHGDPAHVQAVPGNEARGMSALYISCRGRKCPD